jgi:maleylacetoacetate isomerase
MRLYTAAQNSAGERVRIALNLKGLAYEYVAIASLPKGEFRRLNPQGLMPAIEIDGRVVAQSTAILEYLEETHPTPALLPRDPMQRAEARAFGQSIAADLHPIANYRVRKYLGAQMGQGEDAILAWYKHWVAVAFSGLEENLRRRTKATRFCFGEEPGWAECHLVPQIANARRFGCELTAYPLLVAVDAACAGMEAFKRSRPEAQADYTGPGVVIRPVARGE